LDRDVILVARDLLPSEVLTMNKNRVKGIVIETGGSTSHTAILARAFKIPAVMGLAVSVREIRNNDVLVVDGAQGEVLVNPGKENLDKYKTARTKLRKKESEFLKLKDLPAETLDGCRVSLKANIEVPEEAETALHYGAEGIGLYRSEFLFLSSAKALDEDYQTEAYRKVLEAMGDNPVTIRTIDVGGDKILPNYEAGDEMNPLLGWRAIRFSLAQPELFKTQLRAILRSSVHGKARIMFPLVSGLEELEQALGFLKKAKAECDKKGQAYNTNIETGTMIEVPAAAMIADILAEKSAFLSIGTNDLVQYSLAVDRGNERVNYLAQPSHPAVIRFIKMTIDAAHTRGIKAAMCGEMAGDPTYTALLLGLGLDEFSMTASSIPQVKKIIRELTMKDCRALAEEILRGNSSAKNTKLLKTWMESGTEPLKK
jgi:phosphotransferase system enzyme I (PtsI)